MSLVDLRSYRRIVVLTDGYSTPFLAKTGISMLKYRPDDVAAVLDQEHAGKSAQTLFGVGGQTPVVASLQDVDGDAIFVGIAPPGGKLPAAWRPVIIDAMRRGMDIVSGLHDFLSDDPSFVEAARRYGRTLIDVRDNREVDVATYAKFRPQCTRIHAVGNDCSLGKMVTCLEVQRGLVSRGLDAGFAATGQTGIMVAGSGVPIDRVISDFVNGAAERLVLANEHHDFLMIEGQGSVSHPLYSGVTLGLLHGCAPDGLIFCYEAGREFVKGLEGVRIPDMLHLFRLYKTLSNLRHPCEIIGVAANTRTLSAADAKADMRRTEDLLGVPVCDVYRDGPDRLVDAAIELKRRLTATAGAA